MLLKIYLDKQSPEKILQIGHKNHQPSRNINYPKLPSINSKTVMKHYYGENCAKSNAAKFIFIHCILLILVEPRGTALCFLGPCFPSVFFTLWPHMVGRAGIEPAATGL